MNASSCSSVAVHRPHFKSQTMDEPSVNPVSSNVPVNAFPPGSPSSDVELNVDPPTGAVSYNGVPVTNITVSGQDTTQVTVTYTGTSFSAGQWAHVGIIGTGATTAAMENSYWTKNGTPVASTEGHQPGVEFSGTSTDWLVVRVTDYDAMGNVIGHNWSDAQASNFSLVGNPGVDLFVSCATMLSPTEIPLDLLNEGLTGFGAESSIMPLTAPVPEPSSLVAALGVLGMSGYAWARRRRAR
jgi:hypothetical protein